MAAPEILKAMLSKINEFVSENEVTVFTDTELKKQLRIKLNDIIAECANFYSFGNPLKGYNRIDDTISSDNMKIMYLNIHKIISNLYNSLPNPINYKVSKK